MKMINMIFLLCNAFIFNCKMNKLMYKKNWTRY